MDCYDCNRKRNNASEEEDEDEENSLSTTTSEEDDEDVYEASRRDYANVDPANFSREHLDRSDDEQMPENWVFDPYRPTKCLYCNRTRQRGLVRATGREFKTCCSECRARKGREMWRKHHKDCDPEEWVDVWHTPGLKPGDLEAYQEIVKLRQKRN